MMGSIERFKERLRNEDAMKDTEMPLTHAKEATSFIPWNQLEAALQNERLENQRLWRDTSVMANRIEELEAEIDIRRTMANKADVRLKELELQLKEHRSEWLTESESDNTKLRGALAKVGELVDCFEAQEQRIASVLRTFYYADLTLSNVQPLLALCVEMNPDIIEQRR
jgi:chromosome segregation ATPase